MRSLDVVEICSNELERIRPLLEQSPFKPHRFLRRPDKDELAAFWFDTLAERVPSGILSACLIDNHLAGIALFEELTWESRVLGRRIWGISQLVCPSEPDAEEVIARLLDRVLAVAADRRVEAVHCRRFTDDVAACHALERCGFLLMDTQLVYGFRVSDLGQGASARDPEGGTGCSFRLARIADVDDLVDVARACFEGHFGRFHADRRLSRGVALKVYEEWVRSSLGGYADWVVVAEVDGRVAGYSIWRKPQSLESKLSTRVGHYSIGAVHPDFRGRGLFREVTQQGLQFFPGVADWVLGPTHVNNHGVQRAYARTGWQILDATCTFHRWLG